MCSKKDGKIFFYSWFKADAALNNIATAGMAGAHGLDVPVGTKTNSQKRKISPKRNFIRVGFWQNGFFADFYFWAAGFFRGFSRRIFSPHFCGKSAQKNPPGKSPRKSSKIYTTKILRHTSADWLGQIYLPDVLADIRPKTLVRPSKWSGPPNAGTLARTCRADVHEKASV